MFAPLGVSSSRFIFACVIVVVAYCEYIPTTPYRRATDVRIRNAYVLPGAYY